MKYFLWEIENGNSKRPGAEVLYRLAEVLGVTIAHLLGKKAESEEVVEPEMNDGLRAFVEERKKQGQALDAEEIRSLAYVQLRGGRPQRKEQWALIYGMLKEKNTLTFYLLILLSIKDIAIRLFAMQQLTR